MIPEWAKPIEGAQPSIPEWAKPIQQQQQPFDYRQFAQEEAQRQGVDPNLVLKVIDAESGGKANAVSRVGATGYMQLMPATAKELGVDPNDPEQNIIGGIRYLKQNLDEFGAQDLALIAYNSGPGNARKYGRSIPFKETQDYVDKILGKKGTLRVGPFDTGIEISRPLEAGLASAGAATLNAVDGITSLFGFGDTEEDRAERNNIQEKLYSEQFWPALTGNALAQAGMMYSGGNLLRGFGQVTQAAPRISQIFNTAGNVLANPQSWKEAAVGSGMFGFAANPEDRKENAFAGLVFGPTGYGVAKGVNALASAGVKKAGNVLERFRPVSAADIDNLITSRFSQQQFDSLPKQAQDGLRAMAERAISAGDEANFTPEMIQRAADFQTVGISSPLKGWLTRNPMDWVEAHSLQGVDDAVTKTYADANRAFVSSVDDMVPPGTTDYAAGVNLRNTVSGKDAEMKAGVDRAYSGFRSITGRDVPLDAAKFNNEVGMALQTEMVGSKLPADITDWFGKIANGSEPFNFHTAAQRLEKINKLYGMAKDKEQKYALSIVKKHLETALSGADDPVAASVGGTAKVGELSDAFKQARDLASNRFKFQETSPLHEAIISGDFTPEKLPEMMKSIKVDDIAKIAAADAKYGTNAMENLRDAAAVMIRDSAILQREMVDSSGESLGKFSLAGLRRAMDKIGPENGVALFGEQWGKLEAVLRAGGAMTNQPAGVVANNSGTSHAFARWAKNIPAFPGSGPVSTVLNIANKVVAPMQDAARSAAQIRGYSPTGVPFSQNFLQSLGAPPNALARAGFYGGTISPIEYLEQRQRAGR